MSSADDHLAACSFYQYSDETLIKMKMHDINTLPKDRVFEAMRQANLENKNYFHFQHRTANNEIRDVIAKPYKVEELEEVHRAGNRRRLMSLQTN